MSGAPHDRAPSGLRRVVRWPAHVLMASVRVYQAARRGRPSPCRFDPSCSSYALEAVETHGAVRGTWLAVRRVSRCHPWGGVGYDPVPHSTQGSPDEPSPMSTVR